jgi:hypothetical protein
MYSAWWCSDTEVSEDQGILDYICAVRREVDMPRAPNFPRY